MAQSCIRPARSWAAATCTSRAVTAPRSEGGQQEGPVLHPDPREDMPAGLPPLGQRSLGWLSELVQQAQRDQVHGYRLALASVLLRAAGVSRDRAEPFAAARHGEG